MVKQMSTSDVVDEMFQSILATPKRQRRLRSKTFWDKFGFKRRTEDRVRVVLDLLKVRGLLLSIDDGDFGSESKDEWIVLSYVEPVPPAVPQSERTSTADVVTPEDGWFDLLRNRVFESEREVEYYFIVPLLERLGYVEEDFAIGFPVQMYEGVKKVNKEADFVMFNGDSRSKEDALVVIEAKKHSITEDSVGQARGYALWLTTPYYIVTNGDDIRLYLFRGAIQPDVLLLNFKRDLLKEHWSILYQSLHKQEVIEYKAKLLAVLDQAKAL